MEVKATDLKRHLGKYLHEANREPVIVTSRGRVTHVLMSIWEYEKLVSEEGGEQESESK